MFSTSWAVSYWLFFVLCFTSEYLVALSNQSNNATKIPSTNTTEGTPSDTSTLSVELTMDETTHAGHKLRCTEEERQRVGCLNGGECFAVELNTRVAACVCQPGWEGARCQFMELPPDLWEASSLIGLIVGLVAGVAAVVISLLIFFYWKKRQSGRQLHQNGSGSQRNGCFQRNGTREEEVPMEKQTSDSGDEQRSSS